MRPIKVLYKTQIIQRWLSGKLYVLEVIRSLDEAIDTLCESLSMEEQKDPFAEDLCPYFGVLWPAAEALSIYLNDHQELIKNKSVLELGAGLGFPSLVASHHGGKVLCTDFHPDGEVYFKRNCRHSNLSCDYLRLNWRSPSEEIGKFDLVMGSDILYENKHAREVALGLVRFLKPQGKILLSDPGRSYLQSFLEAMKADNFKEECEMIKVQDQEIFVFTFSKTNECIE
jgi:predicted nicotinamide N-methyase